MPHSCKLLKIPQDASLLKCKYTILDYHSSGSQCPILLDCADFLLCTNHDRLFSPASFFHSRMQGLSVKTVIIHVSTTHYIAFKFSSNLQTKLVLIHVKSHSLVLADLNKFSPSFEKVQHFHSSYLKTSSNLKGKLRVNNG